jgi:hypothetical protein
MGVADSFDGKPLADDQADAVAEGDGSSRTGGPSAPRSEPANTAAEREGGNFPTMPASTSGEAPVDPSAAAGLTTDHSGPPAPASGPYRPSTATRSSASWVAAAWASSTAHGRPA